MALLASGLLVIGVAWLFVGCSKPQAPAPVPHEIKLHPVRPPSDQPNISSLPSSGSSAAQEAEDQDQKALEAFFTERLKKTHGSQIPCPPGADLFEILGEADGDLDGDGQDEAAIWAISCMAGNAPDLYAVLKIGPGHKLTEMPFAKEDPKRTFPHMDPKANARGPWVDSIENRRLISAQGIYREGDPNCCPTGGTRRRYYRWNGRALELEDVVDSSEVLGSEPSPGTHKEQLDRSIEHRDRANLQAAMEQVFLRGTGAKTVEEACQGTPSRGMGGQLVYGDLDGDGREEAAMTAYSCFAGTGGPDLFAVFKLGADGKVNEMEFEPRKANEPFKGRDVTSGLRGKMSIAIEEGRLIEEFPVFKERDANCCASGSVRRFSYRWNGRKLALEDVIDLPASSSQR